MQTFDSVSKIRTIDDTEVLTLDLVNPGRGIALTNDDLQLVVTLGGTCTGSCALLRDAKDLTQIADLPVGPANHVAITPPLPVPGGGSCRFAYITKGLGSANVAAVNLCNPTGTPTLITVPGNSFGVTVANPPNGATEVWVSDFNSAQVSLINPLTFAVQTIQLPRCPTGCLNCPDFPAGPKHIAFAPSTSNPNVYYIYVTDTISSNNAVWPISNTIGSGGSILREVLCPIRWSDGTFCGWFFSGGNGIAIKPDKLSAYVTVRGSARQWIYAFDPQNPSLPPTCYPFIATGYPAGTFNVAEGVAWLSSGRAYVGNDMVNKVTIIQQNPNDEPGAIPGLRGNPMWVAVTVGQYNAALPGPSPSSRVR